MRPSAPGYSVRPENRPTGKAWNYFYSLIPRVNSGDAQDDNRVEFRLGPLEARDIPVNLDQDSQFFHHFIRFEVANEYALIPGLTGDVYAAVGNILNGVGTLFRAELRPGDVVWISTDTTVFYFTVASIISDTALRTGEFIGIALSSIAEPFPFGKMQSRNTPMVPWPGIDVHRYRATGVISITATTNVLTGVGTLFTTELVIGDKIRVIDNSNVEQFFIIGTIVDNTNATLLAPAPNTVTSRAYLKFYTDYTDIEFQIYASGGGGQRLLGQGRVLSNQGVNGAGNPEIVPGGGGFAAIRRPYLYGKAGAVTVRVKNLVNDARRVHAHLFGVRIRI
jgi:RNase P/RNase MRP subunit p29